MAYCPNPECVQPFNSLGEEFCLGCGTDLIVGDRYRILKPISAGGFGTTFLAVDVEGDRRCVLKRLSLQRQHSADAAKAAQLFQDEAARLRDLADHPQIPRWLDQFNHDGDPYLVQEFIPGQTLDATLSDQGAFSEAQIEAMLRQLLPVLDHIHRCRIIHRDVKPANIILSHGNNRLVLVDFGASKYATTTVLARTGTMIGSAGYAAPEQILGKATFASDLYGLGVTCIHLLTGVHPFDLYSITEDRWIWRDFLTNSVSDRLGYVLDGLLHRALSQRYTRAADVLQDLRHVTGARRDRSPSPLKSEKSRTANVSMLRPQHLTSTALQPHRVPSALTLYHLDQTLAQHEASISSVAISRDGHWVASCSRDSTVCLWNQDGRLVHQFQRRSPRVSLKAGETIVSLDLTSEGQTLITSSTSGAIKIWDVRQKTLTRSWSVAGWGITATALSSDGELLALGSGDGRVQVWDLVEHRAIATLHRHRDRITALAFTEDGEWLISSSLDRTLRVWDVGAVWERGTCDLLNTLKVSDRPMAITLSPDEEMLVLAGENGELTLWSLADGTFIKTIPAHRAAITAIATATSGRWLVSGSDDSTIKLWAWRDRPVGLEYAEQLTASWAVKSLAFSADQRSLVSGSSDGVVQLWRQC